MTSFANNRYLEEGGNSVGNDNSSKGHGPMSATKFAMAAKRAVKVKVKSPLRASSIERSTQNNSLRKSHSSFGRSHTSFTKMYAQDSVNVPAYYSRPGPGNYFDD